MKETINLSGGLLLSAAAVFYFVTYQSRVFDSDLPTIPLILGFAVFIAAIAGVAIVRRDRKQARGLTEQIIVCFLAYVFFFYGLAKIFALQFAIPGEILAQPLNELDGFWKAWAFFGHSYTYNAALGLIEFGAAVLLLIPRTRTVGSLLFVGIMTNIVLIDHLFGVVVMRIPALVFLAMSIYLALQNSGRIARFALGLDFPAEKTSFVREDRYVTIALGAVLAVAVVRDTIFFWAAASSV